MNEWVEERKGFLIVFFSSAIILAAIIFIIRWQTPAPITILPPEPTNTPGPIDIYISGAVKNPGVYQIPAGSLISDALAYAGGPVGNADLEHVNLAIELRDGNQIYIPRDGEFGNEVFLENGTVGIIDPLSGLININTATLEELMSLPGIGQTYAERIIAYREERGPFTLIEEIMNISGIGQARFQDIAPLITVGE